MISLFIDWLSIFVVVVRVSRLFLVHRNQFMYTFYAVFKSYSRDIFCVQILSCLLVYFICVDIVCMHEQNIQFGLLPLVVDGLCLFITTRHFMNIHTQNLRQYWLLSLFYRRKFMDAVNSSLMVAYSNTPTLLGYIWNLKPFWFALRKIYLLVFAMFNLISIKYNQFGAHVIILAEIMQAINLIRESRKCQTLHRGSDKIYELHIELHKFFVFKIKCVQVDSLSLTDTRPSARGNIV